MNSSGTDPIKTEFLLRIGEDWHVLLNKANYYDGLYHNKFILFVFLSATVVQNFTWYAAKTIAI